MAQKQINQYIFQVLEFNDKNYSVYLNINLVLGTTGVYYSYLNIRTIQAIFFLDTPKICLNSPIFKNS